MSEWFVKACCENVFKTERNVLSFKSQLAPLTKTDVGACPVTSDRVKKTFRHVCRIILNFCTCSFVSQSLSNKWHTSLRPNTCYDRCLSFWVSSQLYPSAHAPCDNTNNHLMTRENVDAVLNVSLLWSRTEIMYVLGISLFSGNMSKMAFELELCFLYARVALATHVNVSN